MSTPVRLLLAASLAILCASAFAADGVDRAKQRGRLVAGVHYVVPGYKAGMKFRTPEAIDTALLEDVAKRLQIPLVAMPESAVLPSPASGRGAGGEGDRKRAALDKHPHPNPLPPAGEGALRSTHDLTLTAIPEGSKPSNTVVIPTGYSAGPMAIMRTDTDIKTWEQLKGRKVCVSEGGLYAGTLAAKYGAIEMPYKAPADALIAVRTGECDATVHDSAMLEELIKLPEWKKFSARLPVGARTTLAFVVPATDRKTAAFLKQVTAEWTASGLPGQLMKKAVRDIAFEVYLDQAVPDCH